MAQSFCNALLSKDNVAIGCIETCIHCDLTISCGMSSWQAHIAKIGDPYEQSKLEGANFCYEWLSYILQVRVKVWSRMTNMCIQEYCKSLTPTKVYNITSYKVNEMHTHYNPSRVDNLIATQINVEQPPTMTLVQARPTTNLYRLKQFIRNNGYT